MRPSLVLLTVASFLAMVLVLLPLPNHWRARNLPTLCVIFWLFFLNLVHFINANIWNENTIPRALVYCDISQKLVVGASIGVHAACFCIIRQLESIASGRTGIQTAKDRTRRRIIDGLICIGCPVLTMVLHYVVQGHRFDILEDFGCMFHAYWSWPTMVIINLPPLLLSLAGFVYGGFTVYWFLQRRSQFNDLLTSSNSGVTRSRYLRLMGLAFTEMTILSAAELAILITNFQVHPFFPYVSWSYVHEDFGRIEQYAHVLLTKNYISQMFLVWWLAPVGALCFFVFFGTGDEAISDYMLIVDFVRVKVLRMKPRQPKVSQYSTGHMPSIKLPKGFSQGPVESYDLEAKWPGDSALGLDSPTSPKDKDREAAPAYAYSSKRADATVSKLSVPVSMTDGSFGRISPTATQYTVSDRASVALSYDERADVDADDLDGDVDNFEAVAPQQGRTSTSTSTPAPAPTRPSFSK